MSFADRKVARSRPMYRCLKRAAVRDAFDPKGSSRVGFWEVGMELAALERRWLPEPGVVRLRFARGWVSCVSQKGDTLFEPIGTEHEEQRWAITCPIVGMPAPPTAAATGGAEGGVSPPQQPAPAAATAAAPRRQSPSPPPANTAEPAPVICVGCVLEAVSKVKVRAGRSMDSADAGSLRPGERVSVMEVEPQSGRVRHERGWSSVRSKGSGRELLRLVAMTAGVGGSSGVGGAPPAVGGAGSGGGARAPSPSQPSAPSIGGAAGAGAPPTEPVEHITIALRPRGDGGNERRCQRRVALEELGSACAQLVREKRALAARAGPPPPPPPPVAQLGVHASAEPVFEVEVEAGGGASPPDRADDSASAVEGLYAGPERGIGQATLKGDDTAPDEVEEAVKKAVVAGTTLTRSGYRYVRAGGSAGTLHTAAELALLDALLLEIDKTDAEGDEYMGVRLRQELSRLGVSMSAERRTWWLLSSSSTKQQQPLAGQEPAEPGQPQPQQPQQYHLRVTVIMIRPLG